MKLTDFHNHTLLSDGALMPAEHIRRLIVRGLYAVAITDHVDGLVADLTMKAGAKLILNTDVHQPRDFISESLREKTALGAGIPRSMFEEVFVKNPEEIIKRITK